MTLIHTLWRLEGMVAVAANVHCAAEAYVPTQLAAIWTRITYTMMTYRPNDYATCNYIEKLY